LLVRGAFQADRNRECLERLQLAEPKRLSERLYAALVRGALA
jgi:hypothetical protein